MRIGIVGSEAAKFTPYTESQAKALIDSLILTPILTPPEVGDVEVISGECHLGGIDIWAKEGAYNRWCKFTGFPPKTQQWSTGYKPRNLAIARASDEVHCITVRELPEGYKGMRFANADGTPLCYHCAKEGPGFADVPHVKSGGCWTMHQARKMGKPGYLHVI